MVVTTNVAEAVIINKYKVVVVKVVEKSGRPFIASHVDVRAREHYWTGKDQLGIE